jgi:two-component system sensor kinase FixL
MLLRAPESNGSGWIRENLNHIEEASLRAGQIVRRIRNFVQPNRGATIEADVNVLVEEVVAICQQEIEQAGVELAIELDAHEGIVAVDPIQIQQVLVNLIQNSLQAMQSYPATDRRLEIRTSRGSDAVRVDLADSGPGFTANDVQWIFEPFHTTKADGLGIGLSICRTIIDRHDGTIWAESKPGHGARVSFTLPVAPHHASPRSVETNCVCS